jgi:hypothetical protein
MNPVVLVSKDTFKKGLVRDAEDVPTRVSPYRGIYLC